MLEVNGNVGEQRGVLQIDGGEEGVVQAQAHHELQPQQRSGHPWDPEQPEGEGEQGPAELQYGKPSHYDVMVRGGAVEQVPVGQPAEERIVDGVPKQENYLNKEKEIRTKCT